MTQVKLFHRERRCQCHACTGTTRLEREMLKIAPMLTLTRAVLWEHLHTSIAHAIIITPRRIFLHISSERQKTKERMAQSETAIFPRNCCKKPAHDCSLGGQVIWSNCNEHYRLGAALSRSIMTRHLCLAYNVIF